MQWLDARPHTHHGPWAILGGGDLTRWHDRASVQLLSTMPVISCNGHTIPGVEPELVLSMDQGYWFGLTEPPPFRCPLVHLIRPTDAQPPHATHFVRSRSDDLSLASWGDCLEQGIGPGWHTGYAALNLAVVLGAATVYLLGFDGGGRHQRFEANLLLGMVAAAWRGVGVVNCNPDTELLSMFHGDLGDLPVSGDQLGVGPRGR